MSKQFRPGSEGAAQARTAKRFFVGATAIIGLLLIMSVTNLPPTFLHGYFKAAALWSNVVGVLIIAAWIVYLWKYSQDLSYGKNRSAALNIAILLVGLILGFGFLYGFTFDL